MSTDLETIQPKVVKSRQVGQTQVPMSLYVPIVLETLLQLFDNVQCQTQIDSPVPDRCSASGNSGSAEGSGPTNICSPLAGMCP